MDMNSCSVCGPTSARIVKGYCVAVHYRMFKKYGDPLAGKVKYSKTCTANECQNKSRSLGLCGRHYERFRKYGDPNYLKRPETAAERFWAMVVKGVRPRDCWQWAGYKIESGYGQITIDNKRELAHRYSYFLEHGMWPTNQCLHSRDNPPCCNPKHLRNGTIAENMSDKVKRGRQARGERSGSSKLTPDLVRQIRLALKRTKGRDMTAIGADFGVSHNTVWFIKTGRTWGWVK